MVDKTNEPLAWRFDQVQEAQERLKRRIFQAIDQFEETTALTVSTLDYYNLGRVLNIRYRVSEKRENRPSATT